MSQVEYYFFIFNVFSAPMCALNQDFSSKIAISISVGILCAGLLYLRVISGDFSYDQHWTTYPTTQSVIAMLITGGVYVVLCQALRVRPSVSTTSLFVLLSVGVIIRLMFFGSTPIYEDDFYRYFFDGQLIKAGLNPYIYLPNQALSTLPLEGIELLGGESAIQPPHPDLLFLHEHPFISRVAYSHISTIYPPISQLFFGLSQLTIPYSIDGWRAILLIVEMVNLSLLIGLLTHFNKPKHWALIYWLNPLLITETINASHMDVLILPFLLGSLLTLVKDRSALSGTLLGLAVGVKFWPALFAPLFLAYKVNQYGSVVRKLSYWLASFSITVVLVLSPQFIARLSENTGLVSYSQSWQTNSFLFYWLNQLTELLWDNDLVGLSDPNLLPRIIIASTMCFSLIWLTKSVYQDQTQLLKNCLIAVALLFFLSPTGYPWYFIWILPFLALNPQISLVLLTPLLALYDLRYAYEQRGNSEFFQYVFITLQFFPPLLLFTYHFLFNAKQDTVK